LRRELIARKQILQKAVFMGRVHHSNSPVAVVQVDWPRGNGFRGVA
jgi:hypothetical protein